MDEMPYQKKLIQRHQFIYNITWTTTTAKTLVIYANYFSMIRRGYLGKTIKIFKIFSRNVIKFLPLR